MKYRQRFTAITIACFIASLFLFSTNSNKSVLTSKPLSIPNSVTIPPQSTLPAIDDIVLDEMAKHNYVGCSVAVVKDGKIVHMKGYGHLDQLRTQPVTSSTVFRWGSISKVITAVEIWRLIEQHKITLQSKVDEFVPYWIKNPVFSPRDNENKELVTVAHLLNHRSGINQYTDIKPDKYHSDNKFNAEQCVDVFSYAPLLFKPGSQFLYSTFGYNLLGAVVDKVSEKGYVGSVNNNIKTRLGLSSLTELSAGHTGYEMICDGQLVPSTEGPVLWKLPGGGWASNIEDLAKFMRGLMDKSLLNNTSELWQPVPNNKNYCFGLVNQTKGTEIRVSHGGNNDEISTEMAFYPSSGLGVVVMINGDDYVDATNLSLRIEKYYGKTVSPDENGGKDRNCRNEICDDKTGADQLVGVWREGNGDVAWRRRLGFDQFLAEKSWLDEQAGYDLDDIETYMVDGVRYWDGIFKKGNVGSTMCRNQSFAAFHDFYEDMLQKGFRLTDIETYLDDNERLWAGVFEKASYGNSLFQNLTTAQFITKARELAARHLKLIDIELYNGNDGLLWAGVWKTGDPSHFNFNLSIDAFETQHEKEQSSFYRLLDVETYMLNGERKWAGIWEQTEKSGRFLHDKTYCKIAFYDSLYRSTAGYSLIDLEVIK